MTGFFGGGGGGSGGGGGGGDGHGSGGGGGGSICWPQGFMQGHDPHLIDGSGIGGGAIFVS